MAIKSPFPGMDPYLEAHWRDVHHRLVTYTSDFLQDGLPQSLRARMEERVFVEDEEGGLRGIYPDVRVFGRPGWRRTDEGAVAVAEPGEWVDNGYLVRLKDIGRAEIAALDERTITRFMGNPAVALGVVKQSTANPLEVSEAVKQTLKSVRRQQADQRLRMSDGAKATYLRLPCQAWQPDSVPLTGNLQGEQAPSMLINTGYVDLARPN